MQHIFTTQSFLLTEAHDWLGCMYPSANHVPAYKCAIYSSKI